jgi:sporulation protein YlmC with PRC-barrel domain
MDGYGVHAKDGNIGHVEDFIIDEKTWTIRYLVIGTRNWWPSKKVVIPPQWIDSISWADSKVVLDLTQDAVRNSPEYTEESLPTREYETSLHGHYNRRGYWDE